MANEPESRSVDQASSYVMGRSSEEYKRASRQALVWEKATLTILNAIGLSEGMNCLDIGCGSGDTMRLMGEKVGRTGRVIGLDVDGKLGRESLNALKSIGGCDFEFVEADIEKTDDISREQFDLTFARFLFIHVRDPISILKKMLKWTKPGGYLVVQDYDFRTTDIYPPAGFFDEIGEVWSSLMKKAGKDIRIGHKLPYYFVKAGVGAPDGLRLEGLITSLAEADWWVRGSYQSFAPLAIKLGVITEEKSKALMQAMNDLQGKESYFWMWPLCVGAWKRKPS